MPEMHLSRTRFTYSASGPFTKKKERINKVKETRDFRYIHQNKPDKVCFQHDMAYRDFKDLNRRAGADKVFRNKAVNVAKDAKYDGYQRGIALIFYVFFNKKTSGTGIKYIPNKELAEELHKPIIRKFSKRKVHSPFIDNIWGADNIWVDKAGEFYNISMKSRLEKKDIEMYSTHSKGKSVIAGRFIRTLKSKSCKYMTSVSKNVYIDKWDNIVDTYNNTYHNTIKMKPVDVKSNTYIDSCNRLRSKLVRRNVCG